MQASPSPVRVDEIAPSVVVQLRDEVLAPVLSEVLTTLGVGIGLMVLLLAALMLMGGLRRFDRG